MDERKELGKLFDEFVVELQEYTYNNKLPSLGSSELVRGLEIQSERLKKKNLIMRYKFKYRGLLKFPSYHKGWKDNKYINKVDVRTCYWFREIYYKGSLIYKKKKKSIFNHVITDFVNEENINGDLYKCPSCGAICKVEELKNQCKYCKIHFDMDNLFPKVTNFYLGDDYSVSPKEMLIGIVGFVPLAMLIVFLIGKKYYDIYEMIILFIPLSFVLGFFLSVGYILLLAAIIIALRFRLIKETNESKNIYAKKITEYMPDFSYDYFVSKVISFLKMVMFSESPEDLAIYVGNDIGEMFKDIIDCSWRGFLSIKEVNVIDDKMYVDMIVYMENLYCDKKRIYKKKDDINIVLCKKITNEINFNFSITEISCSSCGASFDATKHKECPYCRTVYEILDDWVIVNIKK